MPDRMTDMLERYGEVCTKAMAAKILGRCPQTIGVMLADGRLASACAGTMVDVRSIANYIEQPRAIDEVTRQRKLGRKWSV